MDKKAYALIALFGLAMTACSSNPKHDANAQADEMPVAYGTETDAAQSAEYAAMQPIAAPIPEQKVVYFPFDKAQFDRQFMDVINAHAAHLAAHPEARVRLEGHADERGTPAYNLSLGERRAQAVQQALLLKGASASQIEVLSFGEQRPAVKGQDEKSYQENRRVYFSYN